MSVPWGAVLRRSAPRTAFVPSRSSTSSRGTGCTTATRPTAPAPPRWRASALGPKHEEKARGDRRCGAPTRRTSGWTTTLSGPAAESATLGEGSNGRGRRGTGKRRTAGARVRATKKERRDPPRIRLLQPPPRRRRPHRRPQRRPPRRRRRSGQRGRGRRAPLRTGASARQTFTDNVWSTSGENGPRPDSRSRSRSSCGAASATRATAPPSSSSKAGPAQTRDERRTGMGQKLLEGNRVTVRRLEYVGGNVSALARGAMATVRPSRAALARTFVPLTSTLLFFFFSFFFSASHLSPSFSARVGTH